MKKLFLTMCVALLSMGAQAQEKGDFAVGVKGGLAIAKIEFGSEKETLSRAAFGAFAQYNLSNHWRVELEGLYHPKKDHFSDLTMGLNMLQRISIFIRSWVTALPLQRLRNTPPITLADLLLR